MTSTASSRNAFNNSSRENRLERAGWACDQRDVFDGRRRGVVLLAAGPPCSGTRLRAEIRLLSSFVSSSRSAAWRSSAAMAWASSAVAGLSFLGSPPWPSEPVISHEPIWVCPHYLRLAPDRGGQPGRQRRRDRARPRAPARQRHRALPGTVRHGLHLRRSLRPVDAPGRRHRAILRIARATAGRAAARRRRGADSRRQQPVQLRRRDQRWRDSGNRPQAVHSQL